jgi:hypothetical protein
VRIVGSKKGLRTLPSRVLRMCGAILSVMMAVVPAFTQSPAQANSQNLRVTRGTRRSLDVTVVDPSNAVIRKATVILWPGRDTVTIAASTDPRGEVHYRGLSKGTYEIIVQAPAFRTIQQTVTVKKAEHVRVKLQIAVKTETVEVTAAPPVIDIIVNVPVGPLPSVPIREQPYIRLAVI